jgi:hypothetical protein
MTMTANQKNALWCGVVVAVAMLAFPPWMVTQHFLRKGGGPNGQVLSLGYSGETATRYVGYHPLWSPRGDGDWDLTSWIGLGIYAESDSWDEYRLEPVRLGLQQAVLWFIVLAVLFVFRDRKVVSPEPRPR